MTNEWPGDWFSATEKVERDDGITNDHGTLYLTGESGEQWMWMDGVPPHLENRC